MINENIKITNERKFFELYNPKENDCFLKYELYFNDYDFLLTFDSVKPDKLESINLYDALKIGIYDVTIIIYPCDYNNNRMGTNYAKYNVLFEISKE